MKLFVSGWQHGRQDVGSALPLPSLRIESELNTKLPPTSRAQSVKRYANIEPGYVCSSAPSVPDGFVRKNSNKEFCKLISCAAEILTQPFLFGTVFNITSLISFGRDMIEVILNTVPKKHTTE
jgi:hypothetical protein